MEASCSRKGNAFWVDAVLNGTRDWSWGGRRDDALDGFLQSLRRAPDWTSSYCECSWGHDSVSNMSVNLPLCAHYRVGGCTLGGSCDSPVGQVVGAPALYASSCDTEVPAACCEYVAMDEGDAEAFTTFTSVNQPPRLTLVLGTHSPGDGVGTAFSPNEPLTINIADKWAPGSWLRKVIVSDLDPLGTPAGTVSIRVSPDNLVYATPYRHALFFRGWNLSSTKDRAANGDLEWVTLWAEDEFGGRSPNVTVRVVVSPSYPSEWEPCPDGTAGVRWAGFDQKSSRCYARGADVGTVTFPRGDGRPLFRPYSDVLPSAQGAGSCASLHPRARLLSSPRVLKGSVQQATNMTDFSDAPARLLGTFWNLQDASSMVDGCFSRDTDEPISLWTGAWLDLDAISSGVCPWRAVEEPSASDVPFCYRGQGLLSGGGYNASSLVAGTCMTVQSIDGAFEYAPLRCDELRAPCCELDMPPAEFRPNTPPYWTSSNVLQVQPLMQYRQLDSGGFLIRYTAYSRDDDARTTSGSSESIFTSASRQHHQAVSLWTVGELGPRVHVTSEATSVAGQVGLVTHVAWVQVVVPRASCNDCGSGQSVGVALTLRVCDGLGSCSGIGYRGLNTADVEETPDLNVTFIGLVCDRKCEPSLHEIEVVPCRLPFAASNSTSTSTLEKEKGTNRLCLRPHQLVSAPLPPTLMLLSAASFKLAAVLFTVFAAYATVISARDSKAALSAGARKSSSTGVPNTHSAPPTTIEPFVGDGVHARDGICDDTTLAADSADQGVATSGLSWPAEMLADVTYRLVTAGAGAAWIVCALVFVAGLPTGYVPTTELLRRHLHVLRPSGTAWAMPDMPPLTQANLDELAVAAPTPASLGDALPRLVPAALFPVAAAIAVALLVSRAELLVAACATACEAVDGVRIGKASTVEDDAGSYGSAVVYRTVGRLFQLDPATALLALLSPASLYSQQGTSSVAFAALAELRPPLPLVPYVTRTSPHVTAVAAALAEPMRRAIIGNAARVDVTLIAMLAALDLYQGDWGAYAQLAACATLLHIVLIAASLSLPMQCAATLHAMMFQPAAERVLATSHAVGPSPPHRLPVAKRAAGIPSFLASGAASEPERAGLGTFNGRVAGKPALLSEAVQPSRRWLAVGSLSGSLSGMSDGASDTSFASRDTGVVLERDPARSAAAHVPSDADLRHVSAAIDVGPDAPAWSRAAPWGPRGACGAVCDRAYRARAAVARQRSEELLTPFVRAPQLVPLRPAPAATGGCAPLSLGLALWPLQQALRLLRAAWRASCCSRVSQRDGGSWEVAGVDDGAQGSVAEILKRPLVAWLGLDDAPRLRVIAARRNSVDLAAFRLHHGKPDRASVGSESSGAPPASALRGGAGRSSAADARRVYPGRDH